MNVAPPLPDRLPSESGGSSLLVSVRAHKLIVAIVAIVTVAAAVAWLEVRSSSYEATAGMLISPLPQDDKSYLGLQMLRDSGDPTRTAETAATLAESPIAATIAAEKMGPGWNPQRVLDSISVQPEGQSNILAITATADDPKEATVLADTFAQSVTVARDRALDAGVKRALENAQANLDRQGTSPDRASILTVDRLNNLLSTGDPTITFSQRAATPTSPIGAGAPIVIPLALIAGLVLGAGTAALFDLANRRVRDEAELVQTYPLPVLARVPLFKRLGRSGPNSRAETLEAFRTISTQIEMSSGSKRALMITSASTGDGKTTSSVSLAQSMAAAGHSVVLLDLDLRKADVATVLGISRTVTAREIVSRLHAGGSIADLLVGVAHLDTLKVLSVSATLEDAAVVDALNHRLPQLLTAARGQAEYVLIDTPPLGEISDALRIAQVVDGIILVARVGNTRRRNLEITRELLERTGSTPLGYLLIGGEQGATGAYYQSMGMATLPAEQR